jgi:hypothetical protein
MATETPLRDSPSMAPVMVAGCLGPYVDLFLISFLTLFFELACIRWFGSTVVFLTFFTNIVLMACFLGMSVGCLAASRRGDFVRFVLPLTLGTFALVGIVVWVYFRFGRVIINVGGQGSPQQVFFGTEFQAKDPGHFVVPIEGVAGIFFVLIAVIFVGLGQVMGRAFNAIPNRVAAYTTNVLASLVGIAAFGALARFRWPPVLWFGISATIILRFVPRWTWTQILSAFGIITGLALVAAREANGHSYFTIWSPYYQITYYQKSGDIITNNIGHQTIVPVGAKGAAYLLPYLLNRDAGQRPFRDVMIIGAGSGNDVAAALSSGVTHIDAVEIEPVLYEVGRDDHPQHPYQDPRVTVHLDDGRSFARKTSRRYDLIEYGLVDSLVLHSGYSSLRLESFLFTEQALQDIKGRLQPDGLFVMCNYFRQGWIVGRLVTMAEHVFGTKPIVLALPYTEQIASDDSLPGKILFILAGPPRSKPFEAIRQQLERASFFWLSEQPRDNEPVNAYGPKPPERPGVPSQRWRKIGMARVDTAKLGPLPTDDWPFLYLRSATIPALNLRGMALIAILSLAILGAFAPVRTFRPKGPMVFLGAGFMLLETKSVVHMALLFGATWVVNSVVFFAILVMILLSNLFVLAFRPQGLWAYYLLLIIALLVNAYVPMSVFLNLPGASRLVASCAVVFLPIFFAGVIFAASFRDSRRPDLDFGSNIGGVILGGLSENISLIVGFNHLLWVAIGYYVLSALLQLRGSATSAVAGK